MFKISIKAARVNANLTLEQAAVELGVTRSTLSDYECGKTSYKQEVLNKMLEVYDIPFEAIRFN